MKIITAPEPFPVERVKGVVPTSVFLAGSIEMGTAAEWQNKFIGKLSDFQGYIFNPRRKAWDNSWEQSIKNPLFNEQVSWEMTGLEIAQFIYMYFDPNTKSPISLLELGLHATSGKIIVGCPDGFWRKGNVEIVCKRYDIKLFTGTPNDVHGAMAAHTRQILRG